MPRKELILTVFLLSGMASTQNVVVNPAVSQYISQPAGTNFGSNVF